MSADFIISAMEKAKDKILAQHARIDELLQKTQQLKRENTAMSSLLTRNSRELDHLRRKIAALREGKERLAKTASEVLEAFVLHKKVETGHPCPENMVICAELRAAIDAARAKEDKP